MDQKFPTECFRSTAITTFKRQVFVSRLFDPQKGVESASRRAKTLEMFLPNPTLGFLYTSTQGRLCNCVDWKRLRILFTKIKVLLLHVCMYICLFVCVCMCAGVCALSCFSSKRKVVSTSKKSCLSCSEEENA